MKQKVFKGAIVIILISLVYMAGTNKAQEEEETPPIIESEAETVVDVRYIEIPESAANIKGLSEELDSIGTETGIEAVSSNNIETIASSVGLIGEVDETLNINRYQLADILYNIMYECNKLPDIYGYQIMYSDAKEIPTKYVQPVCYVTYLEIYKPDENYSGYNWITEEELKEAMNKLRVYLNDYTESEKVNNKKVIESEEIEIDTKNMEKSNRIQSSAIFTRPSKLYELKSNIANLAELDLSTIKTKYVEGSVEEKVNVDYIEYWQGLYGNIENVDGDIVGLAKAKDSKFKIIHESEENIYYTCRELLDGYNGCMYGAQQVVGVYQNEIVDVGEIFTELGMTNEVFFKLRNIKVDTIGFLIPKSSLEATVSQTGITNDRIIVLVPMI